MSLHIYKPPEPDYRLSKWRLALCIIGILALSVVYAQVMVWINEPSWAESIGWWTLFLLVLFPNSLDWCLREVKSDESDQDS